MTRLRCFIATELPDELACAIEELQIQLYDAPGGRAVKWVNPQDIHLTIKFFGDIQASDVIRASEALEQACATRTPFTLSAADVGCFPHVNRPRVIWVGIQDQRRQLERLQQTVENELATRGFARETRPFQAHLTLGRVHNSALASEVAMLGRTIAGLQIGSVGDIPIDHLQLIASTLTPQGPAYRTLSIAELAGSLPPTEEPRS